MDPLITKVEQAVVARGFASTTAIDRWADTHADEVGPISGALAVARRWSASGRRTADHPSRRCRCGRRWEVVDNSATVHHVVVPAGAICTGWPVLGVPPSWYTPGGLIPHKPKDIRYVLAARHGLVLDPGTEVRALVDDRDTHHLIAPPRPPATEDLGPFTLSQTLTRTALRGFDQARPHVDSEPYAGPDWARSLPGYSFDERSLDRPWELRSIAMVLAIASQPPRREHQLLDEITTIAEKLPVRASIYTAWLWALARMTH